MTDHIHRDLERLCASIERAPAHKQAPANPAFGEWAKENLPILPDVIMVPPAPCLRASVVDSALAALADRVHAFQLSRFPGQSLAGKIKHLKKEADEVLADPADVIEHADCLILILGIAKLSGHTVEELLAAANAKMTINEARDWHPPDHDGVYRHKE